MATSAGNSPEDKANVISRLLFVQPPEVLRMVFSLRLLTASSG
jgi:hypothetical protein